MSTITKRKKYTPRNQPRMSSSHPLYSCWSSMLDRCTNSGAQAWSAYGGRGITVCKRWASSFAAFVKDMGPKPSKSSHLDRINNDGNYTPKNCRWTTPHESARNRRSSVKVVTVDGVMNLCDAADSKGIKRATAYARTASGLAPSHALIVDKNVHRTMAAKHGEKVLKLRTIKSIAEEAGVPYVSLIRLMNAGTTMTDAVKELSGNINRVAERKRVVTQRASGVLVETKTYGDQIEAARRLGLSPAAITQRIQRGWTREAAMSAPRMRKAA